ncbi:MAG TPA: hypothetical protein VMY37_10840 [Thermoguttaceae bacterium]|nr:hypothetical protein [Thermoguttaceae bacterium]
MTRDGKAGRRATAGAALVVLVLVGWASSALPPETVEASLAKREEEPSSVGSEGPPEISGPRDLFDLQGIDRSHFDLLTDGTPWQEGENETLLKIMYRLHRSFRPMDVESWCLGDPQPAELARNPDAYRGEIFRLAGRVASIEVRRPVPEVARRFELGEYYRCEFLLGDEEHSAVLFAHTVPEAWKARDSIDARAGAFGVFLKLAGDDPGQPVPVFVASRVAWYPPTRLGNLGFDWGLFDDLRPERTGPREAQGPGSRKRSLRDLRLTGRNRECFYQMLAAVGRTEPGELLAEATAQLRRAGKERFSVVPLFNQPRKEQGQLVVLSGTARQVIPVRVSDVDVVSRFGIRQYHEIFLFTEDSQSNPLVFCVPELPEGMPVGEGPEFGEYVTVAGFFFNTWAYRNRQSGDASTAREEWQLAPLLIGRDLVWHPGKKPASNPYMGAIAGGLFVVALFGVWLALWRYGRGDRQFHDRTIARKYAPASGVSLDAVGLDADGTPDFGRWEQAADSGASDSGEAAGPGDEGSAKEDSAG